MRRLLTAIAAASVFTAHATELEGFKTLKFGMSETEISEQGFNCSNGAIRGRICSSYNFSKYDANNKNYSRSGVTIFDTPITSASVQFNQQGYAHYISIGVPVDKCFTVLEIMNTTLGKSTSNRKVEPDLNKKQTANIRSYEWKFEQATMTHSYMDLGIRSVEPSCNIVFASTKYKDQVTPKPSKDF